MAENRSDLSRRDDVMGVEDLMAVRSRVSWGAIVAGAVMALASYLILTLLGSAIGLSVHENVDGEAFGMGAAIWATVVTVLSLFLGGWIASICAVGETNREAVIHGILTWGVVVGMLLWLVAAGVGAGFDAMMGMSQVGAAANGNVDWAAAARRAGVNEETINQWRQTVQNAPAAAGQAAEDPANQEAARETAEKATWWALAGTVLSLVAAIGGAILGAGPAFRIFAVPVTSSYAARRTRVTAH
jgi:hypothetical protein